MEALPCPFCGHDPKVFEPVDGQWMVECKCQPRRLESPYANAMGYSKGEAISVWNTRAPL